MNLNKSINEWIARHGIDHQAACELYQLLMVPECHGVNPNADHSENAVQSHVRAYAPHLGVYLWRNNVGVLKDKRGIPVRFGLANDSAQMNESVKSSDLIGITPVLVTQEMVGTTVGVFTAVEVKKANWKFSGTKREYAQHRFIQLVRANGGYAGFVNSPDQLLGVIERV